MLRNIILCMYTTNCKPSVAMVSKHIRKSFKPHTLGAAYISSEHEWCKTTRHGASYLEDPSRSSLYFQTQIVDTASHIAFEVRKFSLRPNSLYNLGAVVLENILSFGKSFKA